MVIWNVAFGFVVCRYHFICDIFLIIPCLFADHNDPLFLLCSTQCLSNMPISAIDRTKIHRPAARTTVWKGISGRVTNPILPLVSWHHVITVLFEFVWWIFTEFQRTNSCSSAHSTYQPPHIQINGIKQADTMTQKYPQMHAWLHEKHIGGHTCACSQPNERFSDLSSCTPGEYWWIPF